MPVSQADTWRADILNFLFVRADSAWTETSCDIAGLDGFLGALSGADFDIRRLAALHHLFGSGGALKFISHEVPAALRTLRHGVVRQRETTRGVVKGRVDWGETARRRWMYSDPSIAAFHSTAKTYDTPQNRLIRTYLEAVRRLAEGTLPKSAGNLGKIAATLWQSVDDVLRSSYLRDVTPSPTITAQMLLACRRSKDAVYQEAARLWNEYERAVEKLDMAMIRAFVGRGWLEPMEVDTLFELYVVVQLLRALATAAQAEGGNYRLRLIGTGAETLAEFRGKDWTATLHYNVSPHTAFPDHIAAADYRYKPTLDLYEEIGANARRPDISLSVTKDGADKTSFVIFEVKNSDPTSRYGRDSIYKAFGYLADFGKLWAGAKSETPKVVVVFREGVRMRDAEAAMRQDVVLTSSEALAHDVPTVLKTITA